MRNLKIEFQDFLPHRTVLVVFQIILNRRSQPGKRPHKRIDTIHYPVSLALSFQGQQFSVTFIQILCDPPVIRLDGPFQCQKVFLAQHCAVHISAPLHQIMRLIDQENIFSPDAFRKEPPQIDMRIKHVIVIADYGIGKQAHIQTHLEGTDSVFLRVLFYLLSAVDILMNKQIIHPLVDPVVVSLGIRTILRITFGFFHKAYLIFRCQNHALTFQAMFPQQSKSMIRHRPGNRLGSQIENPFTHPLSHCL